MSQLRADWEALVAAMGGKEVAGYVVLGVALFLVLVVRSIRGPARQGGGNDGGSGGSLDWGCDGDGGGDGGGD